MLETGCSKIELKKLDTFPRIHLDDYDAQKSLKVIA